MTIMLGVDLEGRDVLLVGGGRVAGRRLQRFVDEGARVRIVAPELHPDTARLVERHGLVWQRRGFRGRDLVGAWLVHVATADVRRDRAIAARCERRQILCINASDAARGTTRLTAQITTGDVLVGVTSGVGADPRRSVAVRDAIGDMIAEGALPLRRQRRARSGRVDLVGGGPGPIDLMTVRARRLIAEADVIITDRLGPAAAVVQDLGEGVEVIDVGKQPGSHPVPQEQINGLIVEHALRGRRVVRLKGGDPFVFGRGGEEMQACLAAGVPVDVTPAPSSAIAVPQAAGIPVTHRGVASAFHVVSGHGEFGTTTLDAMADAGITTVVLMGVAALERLVGAALSHGIPTDRPMAFVESGHTPQQRTTRTTLGRALEDARGMGLRNPAVIVVGDVARADLLLPQPAVIGAALA